MRWFFICLLLLPFISSNGQAQKQQTATSTHNLPLAGERDGITAKEQKRISHATKPTSDFSKPESFEAMQGGAGTSRKLVNKDAFSHPAANLTFEQEQRFRIGDALFRKLWVSSPSSTHASDGLGPLFNARSCQSCHIKDGRGHPPEGDADATSMLLRIARDATNEKERALVATHAALNFPDPNYGTQLQDHAVPGLPAEGKIQITHSTKKVVLKDGTVVSLRKPHYRITNLAYGPLDKRVSLSPRVANPMIGLGLIEAIHPADIIALADAEDTNRDDISGRIALVKNGTGTVQLGRFGWKAQNATVRNQSAAAFAGDIGISTPDMPISYGDCTEKQSRCFAYPTGVQKKLGSTEAPSPVLDLVTFYAKNLAVPKRRSVDDAQVLRGKQLFYNIGCTACHTPKFVTRRNANDSAHSFQLIWPYSDFLLHDMGEELADGQRVGVASGREWRTPPLWGIGLTQTVSGHTFFLHDGRARNLLEAILWHGGEAQQAKGRFATLNESNRRALIAFLRSL